MKRLITDEGGVKGMMNILAISYFCTSHCYRDGLRGEITASLSNSGQEVWIRVCSSVSLQ